MIRLIDYFCYDKSAPLSPKKIVISGGPGTGKTSIVQVLESMGYPCFHEVIREMTLEARKDTDPALLTTNPLAFVPDPYAFNEKILSNRLEHFRKGTLLTKEIVFFDRGLPDVLAYMDYFNQPYADDFTSVCTSNRYDMVLMVPPWEAIYKADNERLENFSEAMLIHQYLTDTYKRLGYTPVSVPEGSIRERATFILEHLRGEHYL